MPNIKVSDSVYERLKTEAEGNFRTIGGQIEFLMANQRTHPVPARDKIEAETPPTPKNTNEKNFEGQAPVRTVPQILAEITSLSESRDEELEYCQDKDERVRIEREYGARIQQLWDEYNSIKGE